MQREPAPELALVGGAVGNVEVSADLGPSSLNLSLWLVGAEARRVQGSGFWVRLGGVDMFFTPVGELFNRARFEATQWLAASDPAPRLPDVWLLRSKPRGLASGVQP